MGQSDFNQIMRLSNQLVIAAKNFEEEQNLSPIQKPTTSKDMDEQLKLAHTLVDVVDRRKRKMCVTTLRYNVNELESSYGQVRLFARKGGIEIETNCLNYELDEYIHLLVVMSSVCHKVLANLSISNLLWKVIAPMYYLSFFSLFE